MENISLDMSGYFNSLERFLDCPKNTRRPFLDQTRQMAEAFVQGNPNATSREVTDFLGDPEELAQGFLETLDPDVLTLHHRKKMLFRWGCVALLGVALVLTTIFGIYFQKTPSNLEVTETIIIYTESMEEIQ